MTQMLPLLLFVWIFFISRVDSFAFAGKATEFKRDKFSKQDDDKRLFAHTLSKSVLQPAEVLAASATVPIVTNSASVIFAKV